MSVDPAPDSEADRQKKRERLIGRFIYEPEFRIEFWKNPEKVLADELGELTDSERCWLEGLKFGRTQQDELIKKLVEDGDVETQAW